MLQEGRAWTQHSQGSRVHLICQLSVLVNEVVKKESSVLEAETPLVLMCSMWYMKQGSHRNVSSVHLFPHQTSLAKGVHKHTKQRHCLVIKEISALKLRKVKSFSSISIQKVESKEV